jgi:alpha-1,6-mannosyltransferase
VARPLARQHLRTSIGLLTAAAVVFRCDVVILLVFSCLSCLILTPRLTIIELLVTGLRWGLTALALTIGVDSIVWKRPLWPEFEVFLFNTVRCV